MDLSTLSGFVIATVLDDPPTWTNKEVIQAVGGVVGLMLTIGVPIGLFAARHFVDNARKVEQEKARQNDGGAPVLSEELSRVTAELERAQCEITRLEEDANTSRLGESEQKRLALTLHETVAKAQTELAATKQNLEVYRRRIKRAVSKDGHSWFERVLSGAPEFKPLDERRTPVIATLNLKGGVGKTTVTANAAVALAKLGYRVLLLDLDLQGSLTGLFVSQDEQKRVHDEGRLLGDFLFASFEGEFPNLIDYCLPIAEAEGSAIVPTTDRLTYAETNLTIRWLLREHNNRDPRFLLRRELQLKRVTQAFDLVLLDCPPFMNMCCVNALAAADYLIVPVLPSKQTTDRVPKLLQHVKKFRENLNAELNVLGILANRTQRNGLTSDEENRFSLLRRQCRNVWGIDVPQFRRSIPMLTAIRKVEDQNRTLRPGELLYPAFEALAEEIAERLPLYCQPKGARAAAKEPTR